MLKVAALPKWIVPSLKSFFAPQTCELCRALLAATPALCTDCENILPRLSHSHCTICALPFVGEGLTAHRCAECIAKTPSFEQVCSPYEFKGPIVALLHAAKFGKRRETLEILARHSAGSFAELVTGFRPDYLLPMPLSWRRRLLRGFNQSYLLVQYLQREAGLKLPLYSGIQRKFTPPQARRSREERLRALKGVFILPNSHPLKDARILVIDDVLTTGATAQALSRILKKAGALEIRIFVIARVGKGRA
jgi:ComF family protein